MVRCRSHDLTLFVNVKIHGYEAQQYLTTLGDEINRKRIVAGRSPRSTTPLWLPRRPSGSDDDIFIIRGAVRQSAWNLEHQNRIHAR